jgi:hypothetical protein
MTKRQRKRRRQRRILAGTSLSLGASLVTGASAQAVEYEVDNLTDNAGLTLCSPAANDCSLRGAIADSNTQAGEDDVTFAASLTGAITITLGGTDIDITDGMNLYGPGAGNLTISGNNASRIFDVNPADDGEDVNIYDVRLTGGNADDGGAVRNEDADLNFYDTVMTGNTATDDGGALFEAGGYYSGVYSDINRTTISGNNAADDGGGVYGNDSAGRFWDVTIAGNIATGTGGGLQSSYETEIFNSTVSGNTSGSGGNNVSATGLLYVESSIFANGAGASGPDITGALYLDHSLVENATGALIDGNNNVLGQDPLLGPLQNNGGPTPTLKPAAGSPVIDKGYADNNFGTPDQRLGTRTIDVPSIANANDGTDIGSVELSLAEAGYVPPSTNPTNPGTTPKKKKKKCKKKKKKGKKGASAAKKCKKKK